MKLAGAVISAVAFVVTVPVCSQPVPPRRPVLVLRVYDGDTLTIAGREGEVSIRIENIDAPEIGWRCKCPRECAFAYRAKELLQDALASADTFAVVATDERSKHRERDSNFHAIDCAASLRVEP